MPGQVGHDALKPNPALRVLDAIVGRWDTVGTHPYLPGRTLHGRATFEWIEGGAFLVTRSEMDEPEMPSGVAIIGSDNATGEFHMIYFDDRDVSRKLDVSIDGNVMSWQRHTPEFSQRMVLTIADDGRTMVSKGEMSRDGGPWEPDLELTYSRTD